MGVSAARLSDLVIVTDDNPRSENPALIRRDILAGAPGAREVPGRRESTAAAIAEAGPEDIILLAGQGNEQGNIIYAPLFHFLSSRRRVGKECVSRCRSRGWPLIKK